MRKILVSLSLLRESLTINSGLLTQAKAAQDSVEEHERGHVVGQDGQAEGHARNHTPCE
jgi:hypothetical protein